MQKFDFVISFSQILVIKLQIDLSSVEAAMAQQLLYPS